MDADGGDGGLEIKITAPELYDSARAKIDTNLRWLFAKAYGEDNVPDDLRDPFYMDQYGVEHIKPPVLELLLSAELYSHVCAFLSMGEQSTTRHTHHSVLHVLARKSIHVLEPDGTPVTHHDLISTPIRMSSHIPLIDALMLACTMEMMSEDQVVSCLKRFSKFSPNKELQRPIHIEEAMVFWINEVISRTREICEKEFKLKQQMMDSPCHQKSPSKWYWKLLPVRYRRDHVSGRSLPHLPVVEDLMKDLCDGAALLTIVHYYCPEYMRLEDICLKEVLSLSDSVFNIQLLHEFSNEYLNRCLYLRTEDLLYAPAVLKHNVMVYIAELFWWFEVMKPDFVKPRDLHDIKEVRALAQPKSARPHMTVSNYTKHSFLSSSPSVDSLATGPINDTCISPKASSSYSLLSLKQRQQNPVPEENAAEFRNRSCSLTRMDGHSPGSRLVWMERRPRPISQLEMEWKHAGGDNTNLVRTISKDSLASSVISLTPRHHVNGQPSSDAVCNDEKEEKEEELVAIIGTRGAAGFREPQPESFFMEPLQPAVLRPNKEKITVVSKREESGEEQIQIQRGGHSSIDHAVINQSFITPDTVEPEISVRSGGFFLHGNCVLPKHGKHEWVGGASESEIENDEEEEDDIEHSELESSLIYQGEKLKCPCRLLEEESTKLCEDVHLREHGDKDGTSGCCSPCPSSFSQGSSASSRMTSFAERRLHRTTVQDGYSSASSSHATTPDGSESGTLSPDVKGGVASDFVHLRLQLEDKRRAIEAQQKKNEVLGTRKRLQLGKAAFLNVVKKGRSDTLPHPAKQETVAMKKKELTKDDTSLEVLKAKSKDENLDKVSRKLWEDSFPPAASARLEGDYHMGEGVNEESGDDLDLSDCSRSIELLNDAISAMQQQMKQLSVQQDLLMKQTMKSPSQDYILKAQCPDTKPPASVQFVEMSTAAQRPPKLSCSRSTRPKPAELKLSKENNIRVISKVSTRTPTTDSRTPPDCRTPRTENDEEDVAKVIVRTPGRGVARNTTFRLHDCGKQKSEGPDLPKLESPAGEEPSCGKESVSVEQCEEKKAHLIEVALSDLTEAPDSGEQQSGLGFFFKDDQKAADELAKKRAAFLLKQQKKAEEARLRKQQLEAESELKRDEARRKAEEERMRKEEEKARRELIKQEYLRRKQQELMEEQGVAKPRPHHRRPRPKSLHRAQSRTTTPTSLCAAPSGSSLSLASTVTEADSITSGGGSQRGGGESVESFHMLSRNSGRNIERDWDNGSTASSITTTADYSGLRLFKEPSAKSNKLIIQNAIAHCCLAGKVNEAQKNAVLEEIEHCAANHLMILFRDGGCQFRALYAFMPETEELTKLSGTGPRTITRKMIDTLFKYSSDRKQFTVIPAKTVSATVDAITIHNHLWQLKRQSSSKRK